MSLQKKIEQEMNDLGLRIIRYASKYGDEKLQKLCGGWFDLKRLLDMANSVVEIDTKTSKGKGSNDDFATP